MDDKKWYPTYIGQRLSTAAKKDMITEREKKSEGPTGELIQSAVTYFMAHVVADVIPAEAALQATAIIVELATEHSRDKAYHYSKTLVEHLKHEIQSNVEMDVASFITERQDKILSEAERNSSQYRKGKGKSKGKYEEYPRGPKEWYRRTAIENADRAGYLPRPAGKYHYKNSQDLVYRHYSLGKGNAYVDRRADQAHICLNHDPRDGKFCKDKNCRRQHIDTKIPKDAERFDKVKSIADTNWKEKKRW